MENELRSNLITCFDAYAAATGRKIQGLSKSAAGDWRFYARLSLPNVSFTARKYDEIIGWFAERWPEDAERPDFLPEADREAAE